MTEVTPARSFLRHVPRPRRLPVLPGTLVAVGDIPPDHRGRRLRLSPEGLCPMESLRSLRLSEGLTSAPGFRLGGVSARRLPTGSALIVKGNTVATTSQYQSIRAGMGMVAWNL